MPGQLWTDAERHTLRTIYAHHDDPADAMQAALAALPHRTRKAINQETRTRGMRQPPRVMLNAGPEPRLLEPASVPRRCPGCGSMLFMEDDRVCCLNGCWDGFLRRTG